MFLNLTFIGTSHFASYTPVVPSAVAYNKITVYGDCTIDKLWGRNEIISDSVIEAYTSTTYIPSWTVTTYILANFNSNLSAGNVTGISSAITHWDIYRLKSGDSQSVYLTTLPVATTSYSDFRAILDEEYSYLLFAKNATEVSSPLVSLEIEPDYFGYFLISPDDNLSFKFDLNSESSSFDTDEDYTEYKTNLRTNVFSRGNNNAIKGTIRALIQDDPSSDTFEQTNAELESLRDLVISSKTKYLKDKRGRIFKIFTYGYKDYNLNEGINSQPRVVEFSFIENGNVYDS